MDGSLMKRLAASLLEEGGLHDFKIGALHPLIIKNNDGFFPFLTAALKRQILRNFSGFLHPPP